MWEYKEVSSALEATQQENNFVFFPVFGWSKGVQNPVLFAIVNWKILLLYFKIIFGNSCE